MPVCVNFHPGIICEHFWFPKDLSWLFIHLKHLGTSFDILCNSRDWKRQLLWNLSVFTCFSIFCTWITYKTHCDEFVTFCESFVCFWLFLWVQIGIKWWVFRHSSSMNSEMTILSSNTWHLTGKINGKWLSVAILRKCGTLVSFLRYFLSRSRFCKFVKR